MRKIIIFLFMSRQLFAAFEFSLLGLNGNGLAGSAVATDRINSAFVLNPAVSSALNYHHVGVQYSQPYGLPEVNFASISGNIITPYAGAGLIFTTLGTEVYQENQLVFNLSRAWFHRRFFSGVNIDWYSVQAEGYQTINTLGIDVGMQYQVYPSLLIGFSLLNVNRPTVYQQRQELPLVVSWGMQFRVSNQFTSYLCLQKDAWFPANVRFGFNIQVNSFFEIQSGMNSYPATPSLGLCFKPKWISVHYSFEYHFDLGMTHYWGVSWSKKARHD